MPPVRPFTDSPPGPTALRRIRVALLILGGISLTTGLNGAVLRLGLWAPVASDRLADLHGPLMVLGFLGTVISLERAQAIRRPLALLAPGLLGTGSLMLVLGAPSALGKLLVIEGAAAFVLVMLGLWRRTRADLVAAQTLGAFLLLIGSVLWWLLNVPDLIPVLVVFLVVTIASERAELAQISMGGRAVPTLVTLTFALCVSAVAAVLWPEPGLRVLGALCVLTAAWLFRDDVGRRMIRTEGFRRFNAVALLASNVWLAAAGLTWVIAGAPQSTYSYDLVVHGVFLGFGFSMIMAHAPTIFPAVLGRALPYRPVMWVPLALLHLGMTYRAMGDVLGSQHLWQAGGVVTVVAVMTFLITAGLSVVTANRGADSTAHPAQSSSERTES
ncbi:MULTISPECIES: hypothetical protein [Kocuria]|uniref:hypothetical protein n=1 Tax=Kocuria TaxID=57493 RepID=UPI00167A77A6|nr:hypothetical protein [Kocuria sp. CPCC 104605]